MKISKILSELAYNVKGSHGTDKNRNKKWGHYYGPAYDYIFKQFNRNSKLDIIEIGTEFGASLIAWKQYFPNSNVSGIDHIDKVKDKEPNINYIITDVKDFKPPQPYDIVIDDGSHKLKDVKYTVDNFKLKVGGVMIIEDCQAPDHWFEAIKKRTKYGIERIDFRSVNGQHDDFLIVLRNYGYYK